MTKFIVNCGEQVWYALEIEAESAEEAECIVRDYEYQGDWDPVDGDHFEIYGVEKA